MSGWFSRTATISAVCWYVASMASTVAPRSSSSVTASARPTRVALISGVSPAGSGAFASAPASSRMPSIVALPLDAASAIGVRPYRFASVACAPAPSSSRAVAASSTRTAQCNAGEPSVPGALTSTFCARSARTAAVSRFMAASASRVSARLRSAKDTVKTKADAKTAARGFFTTLIRRCFAQGFQDPEQVRALYFLSKFGDRGSGQGIRDPGIRDQELLIPGPRSPIPEPRSLFPVLQRPQERQNPALIRPAQAVERVPRAVRLIPVALDGVVDAVALEVVHEPRACMQTPQRRRTDLVPRGSSAVLDDAVTGADVVQQEVAERTNAFVAQGAADEHRAAVDRRVPGRRSRFHAYGSWHIRSG